MSFDYHFKMQIGAPRPVVFERLLRIEHISRWFCGWCRIEPKVGGTFKFGGETFIISPEGGGLETPNEESEGFGPVPFPWPLQFAKNPGILQIQGSTGGTAA